MLCWGFAAEYVRKIDEYMSETLSYEAEKKIEEFDWRVEWNLQSDCEVDQCWSSPTLVNGELCEMLNLE